MDSIIKNYLTWRHGIYVYPKADGRIEVPQSILSKMGWDLKEIYITAELGEIIISPIPLDNSGRSMACKLTNGRVRIPYTISKVLGFDKTPVYMVICNGYIIVRSNVNSISSNKRIQLFLESLSDSQKKDLIAIVRNLPIINNVAISVAKEVYSAKPELILPDVVQSIVFRIIGPPACLGCATWLRETKELFLIKDFNDCSPVFIIPGIQIMNGGFRIGFLLVDTPLYKEISVLVKRGASELIIWYETSSPTNFRIYVNPITPLENKLMDKAHNMCQDHFEFANDVFKIITPEEYFMNRNYQTIPTLVKQNVVVGGKN